MIKNDEYIMTGIKKLAEIISPNNFKFAGKRGLR